MTTLQILVAAKNNVFAISLFERNKNSNMK
jgi:hypothetical protein